MSRAKDTIRISSWDPYHGDVNNRFPRLGALRRQRVDRLLFRASGLGRTALTSLGQQTSALVQEDQSSNEFVPFVADPTIEIGAP